MRLWSDPCFPFVLVLWSLDPRGSWDQYLPLIYYNNDYQFNFHTTPFETLYGKEYKSPIGWFEVGEDKLPVQKLILDETKKVKPVWDRLATGHSRQKSYADRKRPPLAFSIGDHVFLCVSSMKGVLQFGMNGKLSPTFIHKFEILERLALPIVLSKVHLVFHVSMLQKYIYDRRRETCLNYFHTGTRLYWFLTYS